MFDKILTESVLTGLASSLIAAFLTWGFSFLWRKWSHKKRYDRIAGDYKGYGYKKDSSEWELEEEPQSEAVINRVKENVLEIEVTSLNKNDRYKWKGKIYMDSENQGAISWRYVKWAGVQYGGKKHKFGYKKITVAEDEKNIYFYLSPEPEDGFNKAVFIKNS